MKLKLLLGADCMSILDSAINFVAGVISFPSDMYWRFVFWRLKRPRKSRYPDEEYQLAEAILIGRTLQENVYYLGGFARTYKSHGDPRVSCVAKEFYWNAWKALFKLDYLLAGLNLRLWLRMYAWRILRRDNFDLDEFWGLRFNPAYTELEQGFKKLALLLKPEFYEEIVEHLAALRPRLELPKTSEERAYSRLQRLKGVLLKQLPIKAQKLKAFPAETREAFFAVDKAFLTLAHHTVNQLPEGERAKEMKEIRKILDRLRS